MILYKNIVIIALDIVSKRTYSHQWTFWARLNIYTVTSPVVLGFQGCNVVENILMPTSNSFLFPQQDSLHLFDFKRKYHLSLFSDHDDIADIRHQDFVDFPV